MQPGRSRCSASCRVPVLGMVENMAFFDVVAYLRERGGPEAHKLHRRQGLLRRARRRADLHLRPRRRRRKAEQIGVPFLGEVPLNIFLRESGDEGKMEHSLLPGSPARPYLLGVVEQLAAQISIQNIKTPKMPKLEVIELSLGLRRQRLAHTPPSAGRGVAPVGSPFSRHERSVDQHVIHPFGQGTAGGVSRAVDHRRRVEDGDVGDEARADQAAVGQAEPPRGVGGEVA